MEHFTPENFSTSNLGLLLGRAAMAKDRLLDQHLAPYSITAAQFKVLVIVSRYGVDTPAELCRSLSLDSGAMTRMLDRLEQKALIARQRSETDRRQVRLVLTSEGSDLVGLLPSIGAAAMNELVGDLDAAELEQLESLLLKILTAAGDSVTLDRVGIK